MIGTCPMCNGATYCEHVDIGVGLLPHPDGFQCWACEWSEHGPLQPALEMEERPFAPPEAYL